MADEKPIRPMKMGFERAGDQSQTRLGDCLWQVHAAGTKLLEFTSGRTFVDYAANDMLQAVVKTMLGIMAKDLAEMRRHSPEEFARLSDAPRVIEAGERPDILQHEYPRRESPKRENRQEQATWRVVEECVPELVVQSRTLLESWHQG